MSAPTVATTQSDSPSPAEPRRSWRARIADVVGVALVWFALIGPNDLAEFGPSVLLRLPLEVAVLAALALVLPRRAVRPVGILLGLFLGLVTVTKVLDAGFLVSFGRLSRPPWDWAYLDSGIDLLTVAVGRSQALAFAAVAGALIIAVMVSLPWATTRSMRLVGRHPRASGRTLAGFAVVWVVLLGWSRLIGPTPITASAATAAMLGEHGVQLANGVRDRQSFEAAASVDPVRAIPQEDLLSTLRGKDVLVVFVESYGRVALENPTIAPGVQTVLDNGTARLSRAGFQARSAYLTSPTFGGISWLAHATLQSGLWVDSQQRYDRLLSLDRATLSSAFKQAGWRTVSDVPSNEQPWAEGQQFYGYDAIYDATNVGYRGPKFGYSSMPDQYVLDAFRRKELDRASRPPVMAEIDLASSHTPWTPLPPLLPWYAVGDGSIYASIPARGPSQDDLWRDPEAVRAAFGQSIQYSLSSVISFVETYGDPNLVMLVLGDHQPATIVTGTGAGHDVPVTLIARDPAVLAAVDPWGWDSGLTPSPGAPVTRMDAFRDRFVATFSR